MTRKLPITVVTGVLAVAVAACTGATEETTTTTAPSTTTTAETTITTTATTTTTAPQFEEAVTVFVLDPSGGSDVRPGPFLYPIAAAPRGGSSEAEAAVNALLHVTEYDIAVPAGTTIDSLEVDGATASIDLSDEFASGGGTFSMSARLAQLTYTLTAVDGIEDVLLVEDGVAVGVFSSEGLVLDGPMVRDDFMDLLPGILVEDPAAGATVTVPFQISGVAAAFEAVFQLQVLSGDEVVFEPAFVMTDNGTGWGNFAVEADPAVDPGTPLTIRVWEFSAKDGSVISERLIPVVVEG